MRNTPFLDLEIDQSSLGYYCFEGGGILLIIRIKHGAHEHRAIRLSGPSENYASP